MDVIEIPTGRESESVSNPQLPDGSQDYVVNWVQRHADSGQRSKTHPSKESAKATPKITFLNHNEKTTKLPTYKSDNFFIKQKVINSHYQGYAQIQVKPQSQGRHGKSKRYTKTPVYQIPEEHTTSYANDTNQWPSEDTQTASKSTHKKRFRETQTATQSFSRRYSIDLQSTQSDVNDDVTSTSQSTTRRPMSRTSSATWRSRRGSLFRLKSGVPSVRFRSARSQVERVSSTASPTSSPAISVFSS